MRKSWSPPRVTGPAENWCLDILRRYKGLRVKEFKSTRVSLPFYLFTLVRFNPSTSLVPRVVVLHPHDVLFVRKVVEVGVDPEFGHDTHAVFADEAVALSALEGDEVAFDVIFGGEFFVGGAGGDGDGAFDHGPHFAAAVVVLPAEALTGVDHEYFGAQTHALADGYAFDAGEEVVGKGLRVFFGYD